MTSSTVKLLVACLVGLASLGSAMAQNSDQSGRQTVQAEWERMSPKALLCVDGRLRRARRSVNALIDRGVGPSDSRLARIVRDCGAEVPPNADLATPSFECRAATYPDEKVICDNPELARLDRAVVQAYQEVLTRRGSRVAKNISEPLLERRHACDADAECIKQIQLTTIAAFQARGASPQTRAASADAEPADPGYVVDDIRLGSVVAENSRLRDFECTPSRQYPGLTACRRQTTERSRRRRTSVSTSLLHAADGSVVYVGQSLEPVYIGNDEADDEITRLSASFGKASLLPMSDTGGARNGVIASWGTVTLRPVKPDRLASLAAGADDRPGLLIDHIGNPQKSAQSGLPVYRLEGGPGYVWTASWGRRGRGALRMIAIDASRLPGAATAATEPPTQTTVAVQTAGGPQDGTASPAAPAQAVPKPPAAPAAPTPPIEAAPSAAPQPDPPATVRVVGSPIDLRPSAPTNAATPASTPSAPRDGNGLVMLLTAVIVALLGTVVYMFRRPKAHQSSGGTVAQITATAATGTVSPEAVGAHGADRMNLAALVPAVSPDTIGASPADIAGPPAPGPVSDIQKHSAA